MISASSRQGLLAFLEEQFGVDISHPAIVVPEDGSPVHWGRTPGNGTSSCSSGDLSSMQENSP